MADETRPPKKEPSVWDRLSDTLAPYAAGAVEFVKSIPESVVTGAVTLVDTATMGKNETIHAAAEQAQDQMGLRSTDRRILRGTAAVAVVATSIALTAGAAAQGWAAGTAAVARGSFTSATWTVAPTLAATSGSVALSAQATVIAAAQGNPQGALDAMNAGLSVVPGPGLPEGFAPRSPTIEFGRRGPGPSSSAELLNRPFDAPLPRAEAPAPSRVEPAVGPRLPAPEVAPNAPTAPAALPPQKGAAQAIDPAIALGEGRSDPAPQPVAHEPVRTSEPTGPPAEATHEKKDAPSPLDGALGGPVEAPARPEGVPGLELDPAAQNALGRAKEAIGNATPDSRLQPFHSSPTGPVDTFEGFKNATRDWDWQVPDAWGQLQPVKSEAEKEKAQHDAWLAYQHSAGTGMNPVIGRLNDTNRTPASVGSRLQVPSGAEWTLKLNDAWMQGGIDAGKDFKLMSEPTAGNFWQDARVAVERNMSEGTTRIAEQDARPVASAREVAQLEAAGYTFERNPRWSPRGGNEGRAYGWFHAPKKSS